MNAARDYLLSLDNILAHCLWKVANADSFLQIYTWDVGSLSLRHNCNGTLYMCNA